ncbi:MAG: ferrochelatase [Nocardioidaceae bacterium]
MVPIGFVSDHMEVIFDLDTEAAATAAELGLASRTGRDAGHRSALRRPGTRPACSSGSPPSAPRPAPVHHRRGSASASSGRAGTRCPAGCCANPRGPRPALCGADS